MNPEKPHQARNAFAACLQVPGLEHLRFHSLLAKCKKSWNQSTPKYPIFWDASSVVQKLSKEPLEWKNVEKVRDRLTMVLRLLCLYRSVDLERLHRKVSFVDNIPFIWIQRKGWPAPRWEQLLTLPSAPALCPWTLLRHYVNMTSCMAAGEEVFRQLKTPFRPLKADSLGSLTRKMLHKYGINRQQWGAHSTRGAGVTMYKNLGLTSEEVCQIGQPKNATAFAGHYLRLNASGAASKKLMSMVHSVSPMTGAEPERS